MKSPEEINKAALELQRIMNAGRVSAAEREKAVSLLLILIISKSTEESKKAIDRCFAEGDWWINPSEYVDLMRKLSQHSAERRRRKKQQQDEQSHNE